MIRVRRDEEGGAPGTEISRREALATAVGTGFALAVRPVAAGTIATDPAGLDVAEVKIPGAAGEVPAYRALPKEGKAKLPVVLVVHEIFGVHEHIRDVCRRFARQGYLALAPDLFARQGDVTKLGDMQEVKKVVGKVPDSQVMADLDAAVAWLGGTKRADVSRLGITGFCWGGRIVWLYAGHAGRRAALRAGVAWYGRLAGDKDELHPRRPIDVAAALKAPVLGLYGAEDQGIPLATVEEMRKALGAGSPAAKRSEIQVYPGAPHAFFADYRPSYRKDAAEDGWARMLAWFKAHGAA
jgi:carboxymethylenebutenolidase